MSVTSADTLPSSRCLAIGRGCRFFSNSCSQEGLGEGQERLVDFYGEEKRCIKLYFVSEISYQFEIGLAFPSSARANVLRTGECAPGV
jgi:hypothetical protein